MAEKRLCPRALIVDDNHDVANSFARVLQEDRVRSRIAGFDAHVVKPVSPELVESMLKTLFSR